MEEIFIVDAVNYLFRAYYAIGPMINDKGESTSALYGFIRSLQKLIKDFSPKYLVVVFDGPDNKRSRQKVYAEYKMHRKKAPEDLYPQFTHAYNFCKLSGIATLSIAGVEADDTMASIALWAKKKNLKSYLCTTDKDLFQLVSKDVVVLNTYKDNLILDEKKIEEVLGVRPDQVLDLLAIMGDKSDNIPGLEGFGPKTAASLLKKFETLENILSNIDKVPGEKKQEILRTQKEKAFLSKKLASLNTNVEIPTELAFYKCKEPDIDSLRTFYHEMKFLKLLQSLSKNEEEKEEKKKTKSEEKTDYLLINDEENFAKLIKHLHQAKEICIDTETTGGHPLLAKLVGIGFCITPKSAFYIPFNGNLLENTLLEKIKPLIENENNSFYGHNIKYDFHILKNYGIEIKNICFDTILASYLLNPQNRRHGLDTLALEYFDKKKISYEEITTEDKKKIPLEKVAIEKVSRYCCEDTDYTTRLKKIFESEIKKRNLENLLKNIELPLLPILAKMERDGIYIDLHEMKQLSEEFKKEIKKIENEIFQEVGKKFNLNSPKQLSEILYKDLSLPLPRKRISEYSTSADILEKLAETSPFVAKILQYRGLQKLFTTYIEALPKQINPKTGRIHATFNQSITATGRLSCQDPNLQNIPIKSEGGQKIRKSFKPQKKGWSYLSSDYSQIELRLLAHFSEDPELLKAFHAEEDIHAHTASLVYNVPLQEVTKKMRQRAKAVNFGILYGQGPFGLSKQLGISYKEAATFIDTYFSKYKKIKFYLDKCIQKTQKELMAFTLIGRQRPIAEINNKNPQLRSAAERLAINTPLQGTAADLIKIAMIEIDKEILKNKLQGFMILQIHDELIFEIPDEEIELFKKIVKNKMENIITLKVPLLVDIQVGKNWGEC